MQQDRVCHQLALAETYVLVFRLVELQIAEKQRCMTSADDNERHRLRGEIDDLVKTQRGLVEKRDATLGSLNGKQN